LSTRSILVSVGTFLGVFLVIGTGIVILRSGSDGTGTTPEEGLEALSTEGEPRGGLGSEGSRTRDTRAKRPSRSKTPAGQSSARPGEVKGPAPVSTQIAAKGRRTGRRTSKGQERGDTGPFSDDALRRLIEECSVPVPTDAQLINIDLLDLGLVNLRELAQFPAARVFLPQGEHEIRFRRHQIGRKVSVPKCFFREYDRIRGHFLSQGKLGQDKLLLALLSVLDCPSSPFVPHLLGSSYAEMGDLKAAARSYERVIRMVPCFAPAHLNLSYIYHQQGHPEEAKRELQLAHVFNYGNVFGLAAPIARVAQRLGLVRLVMRAEICIDDYTAGEKLDEYDRRFIRIVRGAEFYVHPPVMRAKMISNIGTYFRKHRKFALALDWYRVSLGMLGRLDAPDAADVMSRVLENMEMACGQAGWSRQSEQYRKMRRLRR